MWDIWLRLKFVYEVFSIIQRTPLAGSKALSVILVAAISIGTKMNSDSPANQRRLWMVKVFGYQFYPVLYNFTHLYIQSNYRSKLIWNVYNIIFSEMKSVLTLINTNIIRGDSILVLKTCSRTNNLKRSSCQWYKLVTEMSPITNFVSSIHKKGVDGIRGFVGIVVT